MDTVIGTFELCLYSKIAQSIETELTSIVISLHTRLLNYIFSFMVYSVYLIHRCYQIYQLFT